MNKLFLSESMIADVFWKAIQTSHFNSQAENDARMVSEATYSLVDEFPTEAGSINSCTKNIDNKSQGLSRHR